jgi:signal transduction histidine kinase
MMLIWRRSLAARFLLLVLFALALSQAIAFLVSWGERGQALHAAAKGEFVSRTSSLALLLETTPPSLRPDILDVSGTAYTRFWTSRDGPSDPLTWQKEAFTQLSKPLPGIAAKYAAAMNGQASTGVDTADPSVPPRMLDVSTNGVGPFTRPAKFLYMDAAPNGMGLSVRLDDGTWLNAAYAKAIPNAFWTSQSAISLGLTALILSAIAIFGAQAIARPLRRLANAAELFGRGETVPRLPESGPDDIRQTAEAFNRMQERLQRFVADRTRMLAAISHDLRTPLTSLRLRAEFVQDHDLQEKMLKTIEEIQTMTEAALAYAREDSAVEATRTVDLSALVGSLCDDLAELGQNVTVSDGPKVLYRCRPDSLRRAIRNLVENAVRYGERATVSVIRTADSLDIMVEDAGPGIPPGDMEQVFAPFFRLEQSRNRETGGVGLGLSIARAIARHHGGDIVLENRTMGGLRAIIRLPLIDMAKQVAPAPRSEVLEPSGLRSLPV